jgi:hypothetical protein
MAILTTAVVNLIVILAELSPIVGDGRSGQAAAVAG